MCSDTTILVGVGAESTRSDGGESDEVPRPLEAPLAEVGRRPGDVEARDRS